MNVVEWVNVVECYGDDRGFSYITVLVKKERDPRGKRRGRNRRSPKRGLLLHNTMCPLLMVFD